MKKILLSSISIIVLSILFISPQTSCKKETVTETQVDTVYQCTPNIHGLWIGTYTVGPGQGVPAGTSFYFSFSIYPDGKLSYKSKGFYNGSFDYITFADGTWSLTGDAFSFSVATINIAGGGIQHTQSGTATYTSSSATLTNGVISDPAGGSATWTMDRVN